MKKAQQKQTIISADVVRDQLKTFYAKPVTRVSLELVLTIIIVIVFAVFAIQPTISTITKLVQEIEEKRELDAAMTRKLAALSTAQSEMQRLEQDLDVLPTAYHQSLSLDEALLYFEYFARTAGVEVQSVRTRDFPFDLLPSTTAQPSAAALENYVVEMSFSGSYQSILAFLRSVESIRPLWVVQSYSLRTPQRGTSGSMLTGSLQLKLYGRLPTGAVKLEK